MLEPQRKIRINLSFSLLTLMILILAVAAGVNLWMPRPVNVSVVATLRAYQPQFRLRRSEMALAPNQNERFVATEVELFGIARVLNGAIQELTVANVPLTNDPMAFLAANVHVSAIEGTDLIEVRMDGNEKTANQCMTIVNAVVDSYLTNGDEYERQQKDEVRALLHATLDERQNRLTKLRERIAQKEAEEATAGKKDFRLSSLRQEATSEQRLLDQLTQRLNEMLIDQRATARVIVVEKASVRPPR